MRCRTTIHVLSRITAWGTIKRMRFIMNTGRDEAGTADQRRQGSPCTQAIVTTMSMHPDDMKAVGILSGSDVHVRSEYGEATFRCVEGKVPRGMIFVPYGPADVPRHG